MSAAVKHPVAPTMRYAFLKALDIIGQKEGKTLPEIVVSLMYDGDGNFSPSAALAVMDRVAKFAERTGDVNVTHSGEVTSLVSVLTGITQSAGHDTPVEGEPESVRH